MTCKESFKICFFEKYRTFEGRATRSEYWWFWLIFNLMLIGLAVLTFLVEEFIRYCIGFDAVPDLVRIVMLSVWAVGFIGLFCPFVAVSERRLHDGGHSGWNLFWMFVPYIGPFILFFLMLSPSKRSEDNV